MSNFKDMDIAHRGEIYGDDVDLAIRVIRRDGNERVFSTRTIQPVKQCGVCKGAFHSFVEVTSIDFCDSCTECHKYIGETAEEREVRLWLGK